MCRIYLGSRIKSLGTFRDLLLPVWSFRIDPSAPPSGRIPLGSFKVFEVDLQKSLETNPNPSSSFHKKKCLRVFRGIFQDRPGSLRIFFFKDVFFWQDSHSTRLRVIPQYQGSHCDTFMGYLRDQSGSILPLKGFLG